MTRFVVLTAMAMILALWFVVADIRRMRRAREMRQLRNVSHIGTVELSDGTHSVELAAHWQGHATN